VAVLIGGGLIVIVSAGRDLSPGGLMAFYVLLLRLYVPAASFAGSLQTLEQAADALARVRKILDLPPEADPPEAINLGPLRRALVFQDVQLVQPNGKAQLKGLTAEVPVGARVAFVGPTGSGKPSLLSLLARLEEPSGGAIRWDGADIGGATRESLRSQLSVLLQDTFVLRTTIYDNLRLGRPEAGEAEVLAAARMAGFDAFVASLPNGYDTMVSDRDPLLSTPVRQRLGVAQALLADASVVVMDDATAALEMGEQRQLEAALRGPDGSRTLIRVAQRPSTVADADRIYVLDDGRVIESGTHDELVERRGLYAQLLKDEMGEAAVSGARQAVRRISKLAPFADLPPEVLDEMAKLLLFMEREAGQEIVRRGSVGDELFIVGRGEVEVVVADEEGNERVVNALGEGDYFGEISFLRRTPRTATIRARSATELHILRRLDFDHLLAHLGEGTMAQIEATARARIEDTRAKLAALSG
jgi:ATP-binding cassette, subfamily B, bacterial